MTLLWFNYQLPVQDFLGVYPRLWESNRKIATGYTLMEFIFYCWKHAGNKQRDKTITEVVGATKENNKVLVVPLQRVLRDPCRGIDLKNNKEPSIQSEGIGKSRQKEEQT